MDCVMRAFAGTMVSDSGDFCKAVLVENVPINKLKDTNNQKLTDKHLCEAVGKYLNLPVYDLYKKYVALFIFLLPAFIILLKQGKIVI